MAKLFIDLTEDERFLDGNIPVRITDRDNLTGKDCGLLIGDEIEIVLSVRQAITLFDVLDGWMNGGPAKTVGGIEKRVLAAIKETVGDYGEAVRAVKTRPEELAHVIYENLKLKGVRFRLTDEE